MSYNFDVFISYASADGTEFATSLNAQLKAAGWTVWFDQEQMRGGSRVNESLAEGLRQSQHIIYVMTTKWFERAYTRWEPVVFEEQQGGRRQVPISLIGTPLKEKLGPHLAPLKWLEWSSSAKPEAKYWEVHCALRDEPPGPPAQWEVRGREALGYMGPAIGATQAAASKNTAVMAEIEAPIVFGCGRKEQWGDLATLAATHLSKAIFVVGPQRQAHDFFLARVHNCLPKDPPRRIVSVRWNPPYPPVGRGGYLAALREAFGCTSDEALKAELKAQREGQNLVLVHRPVAQDAFDRDDLVRYYTEWLPALLEELPGPAGPLGGVKAIQAVAWQKVSLLASLLNTLGRRANSSSESLAQDLLEELRRRQDARLPIRLLDELEDLEDQEIVDWSELLPRHFDRSRILGQVLRSGKDSETRLATITHLLAAHWRQADER